MTTKIKHFAYDISKDISKGEIYDFDVINQSFEIILTTMFGDRLFNPNFGSILGSSLFETINTQSGEKLLDSIIDSINRLEKRAVVLSNQAKLTILSNQRVVILDLPYTVKNSNSGVQPFVKQVNF
jgi:phage baseplate assembly protein W